MGRREQPKRRPTLQAEALEQRDVPTGLTLSTYLSPSAPTVGNYVSIAGSASGDEPIAHMDVTFSWGDGSTADTDSNSYSPAGTMEMVGHMHPYAAAGGYTIDVTAHAVFDDGSTGDASQSFQVTVSPPASPPPMSPPPPPPPTTSVLTITKIADASEAGAVGDLRVTRTGDASNAMWFLVSPSGTADPASDYTVNGTTLGTQYTYFQFPAGASSVDLAVNAVDDTLVEGDESVILTLMA